MTVKQLFGEMESRIPRALSAEWDNDGLACLPQSDKELRRVLVALDATEAVVDRATNGNFDLLITHHPLLFRGVKALTDEQTVSRKLLKLARANVAAISFHTRLDAVTGGVNDLLASALDLVDVRAFAPDGEVPCGRIGKLKAPMSADEFAKLACRALQIPSVLVSGDGSVQTVAVLGGEGGDFVDAARREGADLFLAGRIGYHRMLDGAEDGIILVEAGHFATEVAVCRVLADMVAALLPSAEIEIYDTPAIRRVKE